MNAKQKGLIKKRRELIKQISSLKKKIAEIKKKRLKERITREQVRVYARHMAKIETDLKIAESRRSAIENSLRLRASLKPNRIFRIAKKIHKK